MINIAIDGPSGAGKSTISRLIAEKLGFIYADTGALYRAAALAWTRSGGGELSDKNFSALAMPPITLAFVDGVQHVLLGGEDISGEIRSPEISQLASRLSVLPSVREFLLGAQRKIAEENNVIMDGRDIGSVVLPAAEIKIFLTASPGDRARRRFDELCARGVKTDYETVLREINERDGRDSGRAVAPLRPASGAEIIDTTGNSLEKSVSVLEKFIRERLAAL
ncbi:MAG: (d)CMP kinase [Oscillospiraceae bacterium]|nr:(d)CMP kinase [Oscillospiraceae bacterium]